MTLANGFGEEDLPTGALAVPIAVMYPHLKASFTYKRPTCVGELLPLKGEGLDVRVEIGLQLVSCNLLGPASQCGMGIRKGLISNSGAS